MKVSYQAATVAAALNRLTQLSSCSGCCFHADLFTASRVLTFEMVSSSTRPFALNVDPVSTRSTIRLLKPIDGASSCDHSAVQLNAFSLNTPRREVSFCQMRVFCGHPHM